MKRSNLFRGSRALTMKRKADFSSATASRSSGLPTELRSAASIRRRSVCGFPSCMGRRSSACRIRPASSGVRSGRMAYIYRRHSTSRISAGCASRSGLDSWSRPRKVFSIQPKAVHCRRFCRSIRIFSSRYTTTDTTWEPIRAAALVWSCWTRSAVRCLCTAARRASSCRN